MEAEEIPRNRSSNGIIRTEGTYGAIASIAAAHYFSCLEETTTNENNGVLTARTLPAYLLEHQAEAIQTLLCDNGDATTLTPTDLSQLRVLRHSIRQVVVLPTSSGMRGYFWTLRFPVNVGTHAAGVGCLRGVAPHSSIGRQQQQQQRHDSHHLLF